MIWVQHDLYKNFMQSIKSGDIYISLDIFRSEISDLLTYNSKSLFSLFEKLNIKYKKKASYSELLDVILKEIKSNDKFIKGISFLMVEGSDAVKKNKKVPFIKILNSVTKGIKLIAQYFKDYPAKESLFKRKTLEMLGLKSSITGNDSRELKKKDNTVLWILGIAAVGVAGYFIYKYFDKQKEARLKAESLSRMNMMANGGAITPEVLPIENLNIPPLAPTPPAPIDPAYIVPTDVLLPEIAPPIAPPIATANPVPNGMSSVQINVQPVNQPNQI
jgi:hypothetical protein